MNNSTVIFTTPEATAAYSFGLMDFLEMFICSLSFFLGLSLQIYVLWLVIPEAGNGGASMFFRLNLCVCEIGISLTSLLFILSFWFSSVTQYINFLIGLGITGRPLFQCLMCVDFYLAVVHPVTFLKLKPLRYRAICCAVVWIITIGSCFCTMFFSLSSVVLSWFFTVQFVVFIFIQMFCLVAVLKALKQSGPGDRVREREEENHMKRRAFFIILITTVNMVITYAPYTFTGVYTIVTKQSVRALWVTCLLCYLLAGFVQPVLHLYCIKKLCCFCASSN